MSIDANKFTIQVLHPSPSLNPSAHAQNPALRQPSSSQSTPDSRGSRTRCPRRRRHLHTPHKSPTSRRRGAQAELHAKRESPKPSVSRRNPRKPLSAALSVPRRRRSVWTGSNRQWSRPAWKPVRQTSAWVACSRWPAAAGGPPRATLVRPHRRDRDIFAARGRFVSCSSTPRVASVLSLIHI